MWSEMLAGGSMTDAPTTPMFICCGGGTPKGSKKSTTVNEAVTQAISQITAAIAPTQAPLTSNLVSSPAKTINNRSKCYKQLGKLRDLKESSLLSEEEYTAEREAIMHGHSEEA